MIAPPAGVRVFLACGATDMRKGMIGLAMLVQQGLSEDPFSGALFAFRGRRAGLIKVLWHDGIGLCLLTKRLERGQFIWPTTTTSGRIAVGGATTRPYSRAANGARRCGLADPSWPGRKLPLSQIGLDASALFMMLRADRP